MTDRMPADDAFAMVKVSAVTGLLFASWMAWILTGGWQPFVRIIAVIFLAILGVLIGGIFGYSIGVLYIRVRTL